MSRHPSEASLALYAGGELGRFGRWRIGRHVAACSECREDVSDFSALRGETQALAELPEMKWNAVAAEIRANIRLGLEAGECVTPHTRGREIFSPRAIAACVSLAALLIASVFLERPAPRVEEASGVVLESTGSGIQMSEGQNGIMLLNSGALNVSYVATGSTMRARYVDKETGYVTVNDVYAQ